LVSSGKLLASILFGAEPKVEIILFQSRGFLNRQCSTDRPCIAVVRREGKAEGMDRSPVNSEPEACCCAICHKPFSRSRFHPGQKVCSQKSCQQQRRQQTRKQQLLTDLEYRKTCLNSAKNWRAAHPRYWREYRATHPQSVERNRRQQQSRDLHYRLADLANNNSARELNYCPAMVCWYDSTAKDSGILPTTSWLPAKILILQQLKLPATPSSDLANNIALDCGTV
jgi:hypothetical protein